MNSEHNTKKWVLLEQLPLHLSKRLLLLLFLYSLAFTLLLVGLRMFQSANAQTASPTPKESTSAKKIQESIADGIIRLHVIANSDTNADQSLKLQVRDRILHRVQSSMTDITTPAQAEQLLTSETQMIQQTARSVITENGYDYPVTVTLDTRYFPAKTYGDLTFPPGCYRALCVEIGAAQGRNWWCVLFPSLCFVDETTATVPEDSKKKLQEEISEDAYNSLSSHTTIPDSIPSPSPDVEFHSALYDWITGHE